MTGRDWKFTIREQTKKQYGTFGSVFFFFFYYGISCRERLDLQAAVSEVDDTVEVRVRDGED